ncbi:MAG TPA: hypothetical protein PL167_05145 [Cyclobacteriaceae bacterium]|nr:hypothetical protein [Cyclobacteriaceae bacterium]
MAPKIPAITPISAPPSANHIGKVKTRMMTISNVEPEEELFVDIGFGLQKLVARIVHNYARPLIIQKLKEL